MGGAINERTFYGIITLIFIVILLISGCTAFIGRYDPPLYSGEDHQYFERLIDSSLKKLYQSCKCKLAADSDLIVVGAESDSKNKALNSPLLLRFAWFSDVQLRQPEVKLFSRKISRELDDVIPTFEHNFVQEDFDWVVYLSLIAATNLLSKDQSLGSRGGAIDFMIHTGDSIDAGIIYSSISLFISPTAWLSLG